MGTEWEKGCPSILDRGSAWGAVLPSHRNKMDVFFCENGVIWSTFGCLQKFLHTWREHIPLSSLSIATSRLCQIHPSFIMPKQQNIKAHKIKAQSNTNQNIKTIHCHKICDRSDSLQNSSLTRCFGESTTIRMRTENCSSLCAFKIEIPQDFCQPIDRTAILSRKLNHGWQCTAHKRGFQRTSEKSLVVQF